MNSNRLLRMLSLSAVYLGSMTAGAESFTPLGNRTIATAISADGSTVVGYVDPFGGPPYEAFVWNRSTGLRLLGDFPGGDTSSIATDVSADGSIVVGHGNPAVGLAEAFIWSDSTGLVGIGDLPGGSFSSGAQAVSADGIVVVGSGRVANLNEAFIWDSMRGMRGLGDLPGGPVYDLNSYATDVSADGTIVVGIGETDTGSQAFIWDEINGLRGLGAIPGALYAISRAHAISADGTRVVGQARSAFGDEAFIWDASNGMRGLGRLAGGGFHSYSAANGVSADGRVIVGSNFGYPAGSRAVIWNDLSEIQELSVFLTSMGIDLTGWQLESASDISADGSTIVGTGRSPSGQREAWIAVVPEPASSALLWLGLAFLARRRRNQDNPLTSSQTKRRGAHPGPPANASGWRN